MKIHIVQKGDTMWSIASKYGVSFDELREMNRHIREPELAVPGMKLKIPTTTKATEKEVVIRSEAGAGTQGNTGQQTPAQTFHDTPDIQEDDMSAAPYPIMPQMPQISMPGQGGGSNPASQQNQGYAGALPMQPLTQLNMGWDQGQQMQGNPSFQQPMNGSWLIPQSPYGSMPMQSGGNMQGGQPGQQHQGNWIQGGQPGQQYQGDWMQGGQPGQQHQGNWMQGGQPGQQYQGDWMQGSQPGQQHQGNWMQGGQPGQQYQGDWMQGSQPGQQYQGDWMQGGQPGQQHQGNWMQGSQPGQQHQGDWMQGSQPGQPGQQMGAPYGSRYDGNYQDPAMLPDQAVPYPYPQTPMRSCCGPDIPFAVSQYPDVQPEYRDPYGVQPPLSDFYEPSPAQDLPGDEQDNK